ncbi:MAG: hypothetical protein E6Q97_29280 [Desulfurellales bacterium]|nr:MAG: hypothetical protein E6Q97_29280 [Desulfurellales bacterium]
MKTILHEHDGDLTIERVQDCTPYVEHTKRLHNAGAYGDSEFKLAATIPFVIIEQYCNINQIRFDEFMGNPAHMKALLNDPQFKSFRVWPGRV